MKRFIVIAVAVLVTATAWARGGGGCVEEGTLIATPAGEIPVERLAVGDVVWSATRQPATVQAIWRVEPAEVVEIGCLRVTPEHPVAIAPGEFRCAGLLPGARRVQAERPAYNLLVSPGGTFFANGVLVHNKGCFLPDTPILRADGTPVAISQLQRGDRLLAFTAEGTPVETMVRDILVHDVDDYLVVATDRIELRVTAEHPFYVGEGTFKTLEALRVGDRIYAFDGNSLTAQQIVRIARIRQPTRVYNLQTDAPNTYFANGIAVHNKGGGCFAAGTQIQTPAGVRRIESLAVGDVVSSVKRDGRITSAAVESVHKTRSPLVIVNTDRGVLRTTAEHPVRLKAGAFLAAGELVAGQRVEMVEAGRMLPARVRTVEFSDRETDVFNLSVSAPHTFIADKFVVHNKGGGGFHGGSHGYRGGRSSGGSGDPRVFFIVFGLIVAVVVVSKVMQARQGMDEDLDFVYSPSVVARKADKTRKLLEFIARTDAVFDPMALQQRATQTFVTLQECWQAREYAPMQPLLMPDLYADHVAQLQGLRRHHEINVIEGLDVKRVDLVNVRYTHKESDREFTALITARAQDYYVDDRNNEFQRGDESPATFQEFWTFQWQDGTWLLREIEQTRESDVLKDENFFEQFTDAGRDKVYAETAGQEGPAGPWLEPGMETKATRTERMLNFLVQTDKLWNRQAMLQRARDIFTAVMLAQENGDPDTIPTDKLFPDAAEHLRQELTRWRMVGTTVEYRNLCVRKVELVLVQNFADSAQDEFTVRISAHAQKIVNSGGRVVSQQEYVTPFEEYWTFGRLDNQWKLKEVVPPAQGEQLIGQENVDQESSPDQVKWYYSKTRAN